LLSSDSLKDLLHQSGLSQTDRILLCLAVDDDTPKSVSTIVDIAVGAGLRSASKWNISSLLSRSRGLAIRGTQGWELTSSGKDRVRDIAGSALKPAKARVATSLRSHLSALQNPQTSAFVEEAVSCFEYDLHRAAIVLSWVGAVSVLYEHVVNVELLAFNTEAKRRDPKWRDAKTSDDLARMKEREFLDILEAISVLGRRNCAIVLTGAMAVAIQAL
jgi:hypothetical protein